MAMDWELAVGVPRKPMDTGTVGGHEGGACPCIPKFRAVAALALSCEGVIAIAESLEHCDTWAHVREFAARCRCHGMVNTESCVRLITPPVGRGISLTSSPLGTAEPGVS
jgi:hypothetical protein